MKWLLIILYLLAGFHVATPYHNKISELCFDKAFERSVFMMVLWPIGGFIILDMPDKSYCDGQG